MQQAEQAHNRPAGGGSPGNVKKVSAFIAVGRQYRRLVVDAVARAPTPQAVAWLAAWHRVAGAACEHITGGLALCWGRLTKRPERLVLLRILRSVPGLIGAVIGAARAYQTRNGLRPAGEAIVA